MTRNRILVSSSLGDLITTSSGLGIAGNSQASVLQVALSGDVEPGHVVRPGDYITNANDMTLVSAIASIDGSILKLVAPIQSVSALQGSYRIRSRGIISFTDMASPLIETRGLLSEMVGGDLKAAAAVYLQSGANHSEYYRLISDSMAILTTLRQVVQSYEANAVNSVSALLDYLRSERMDTVLTLLLECRFVEIVDLEPHEMSGGETASSLLEAAAYSFGVDEEDEDESPNGWTITDTEDVLGDYYHRPSKQLKAENEELGDDGSLI